MALWILDFQIASLLMLIFALGSLTMWMWAVLPTFRRYFSVFRFEDGGGMYPKNEQHCPRPQGRKTQIAK
jgi:hypothetical protein